MTAVFDIHRILDYLPHRYPFVLVDRILELDPGKRVVALKNVTINEPFFPGHFPAQPIMPGVLIIESMGQAGAILAYHSMSDADRKRPLYFGAMDRVRFRRPVVPGDQLVSEVRLLRQRSQAIKMGAVATVADRVVAEAELMATFGDKL